MLKKLRVKFVIINMAIVAVMLCVIFSLVFHFTRQELEKQSMETMQRLAVDPLQLGALDEFGQGIRLPYFTLQINAQGDIIASGGGYFDLSDEDFLKELIGAAFRSPENSGVIHEYNLRYLRVSRLSFQCLVFVDISGELATLRGLYSNCALIGAAAMALFLLVSLLLARWAVKPVESAWLQQRQFIADASHELKTPLAVIMTNAELLRQPDYPEPERRRFSESILIMSRQMRELVERLLELARADSGRETESPKELDFSKLVSDSLLPFEPLFFESDLGLEAQVEAGIRLNGREQALRQALEILLDNARKYSPPASRASLSLGRHGRGHCILSVSNPCAELSKQELKDIFKRFYRLDKARSRDGGYGLGLPIAKSIIIQHHGRIWAEYRAGQIHFNVLLPILF